METFPSVSEGFAERLDFYSGNGMTHYFYSPSDDRYCNAWGWKFLYNDSDRQTLRNLRSECEKRDIEFVWTVRPGEGYAWNDRDYEFLLNKLIIMYYNGIRSFAVNFSGTQGDFSAIKDSLNVHMAAKGLEKTEVLIVDSMPSVFFPSAGDAAETLMRGYHFDDAFRQYASKKGSVLCQLSEKSELSRIAVTAVSDLARVPDSYDADESMSRGMETLSPEVKEPFMVFLEHTGGIRESESVETFTLSEWSEDKASRLLEVFRRIETVPQEIASCSSPAVLNDFKPWLEEFRRLGARGCRTIECLEYYQKGDLGAFWISYMNNRMSAQEVLSYEMHKVGEAKLHPFCVNMMQELTDAFTSMLTGNVRLKNLASTLYSSPNQALDSDFTTSMQSAGHVEFPIPADANTCRLLTGPLPEGQQLLFRQLGTDGDLLAEFVLASPYSEFDLKEGAVKVDVLGNIDIYESIFVYL